MISNTTKSKAEPCLSLVPDVRPLSHFLVLLLVSLFAINPTESNILHHFIFLSYRIEDGDSPQTSSSQYGKGPWDLAFVSFYTLLLYFARSLLSTNILHPLAIVYGIDSPDKQSRFTSYSFTVCYTAIAGALGLYVMGHTPGLWYFNTKTMQQDFSPIATDAVFKSYYLFGAAFWIQEAIFLLFGPERRRKDFVELLAHHALAISMIGLSYRFHFTYMGIAVLITHDISDFFFAITKCLVYAHHPLRAHSLILSIIAWAYLRQYINLHLLYSLVAEFHTVGPYEHTWTLDFETEQFKNKYSQLLCFIFQAALQALNLFWLYCLIRCARRYMLVGNAKDDRSDVEGSENEDKGEDMKRRRLRCRMEGQSYQNGRPKR